MTTNNFRIIYNQQQKSINKCDKFNQFMNEIMGIGKNWVKPKQNLVGNGNLFLIYQSLGDICNKIDMIIIHKIAIK